jgi:hypothetical protein
MICDKYRGKNTGLQCVNNIQDISAKQCTLIELKISEFKHEMRKTSTSKRRISNENMT